MKLKKFLIILSLTLFLSFNFGSAEFSYDTCCKLAVNGDQCVSVDSPAECTTSVAPSDCQFTSFCRPGCCYDTELGVKDSSVLKSQCEYNWDPDPECNIPGLEMGCCVLEFDQAYVTRNRCELLSEATGLSKVDWRLEIDELECIFVEEPTGFGACVFDNGDCTHGFFQECNSLEGSFSEGFLCTSSFLRTKCKPTAETACVNGKDGVYFVDSCGNIANIYDSSKVGDSSYWDKIIEAEDSCGASDSNGNGNSAVCGNCNRFKGSFCSIANLGEENPAEYGDYFCKSTDCILEDGRVYKSGESWCEYDAKIGDGNDVPGSRHWKFECNNAEVQLEPCADFRNEVCEEKEIETPGTTEKISGSICKFNDWRSCIDYNTKAEDEKGNVNYTEIERLCSANDHCFLKKIDVDDVQFSICVSKFPGGFEYGILEEDETEENKFEDICEIATQKCTYIEERSSPFSSYECIRNCGCRLPEFTEEMNNICRALGDCGSSINYVGSYSSSGFSVSNRGSQFRQAYIDYLNNLVIKVNGQGTTRLLIDNATALNDAYNEGYISLFVFIRDETGATLTFNRGYSGTGLGPLEVGAIAIAPVALVFGPIALIAPAFGGFLEAIGWSNTRTRTIDFTCNQWVQPFGGEDCQLCNNQEVPCSEYRCSTLGASCGIINKGTDNEICVWKGRDDATAPIITPEENVALNITNQTNFGFNVAPLGDSCFYPYEDIIITLKTNEPAICKYDFEEKDYEDLIPITKVYSFRHTINHFFPDPSHGESRGMDVTANQSLYIKCVDPNGNIIDWFYEIKMCVNEGPDIYPPKITSFNPESGHTTKFNASNQIVYFFTNEPATCRWDKLDKSYGTMQNNVSCLNDIEVRTPQGYVCLTTLNLSSDSETYYFRCSDQPWLEENETRKSERNQNLASTIYRLNRLSSQIEIVSIEPNEDYTSPTSEATFDIVVETKGGGVEHVCSYSRTGFDSLIEMWQTGEVGSHIQPVVGGFTRGKNTIFAECIDETKTKARANVSFEIIYGINTTTNESFEFPPEIARVWQEDGALNLITTSEVECRYSLNECSFNWTNGIDLGNSIVHRINVVQGKIYYIKCKDSAGAIPNDCSLRVIPV